MPQTPKTLLQIDFPFAGPWGSEMALAMKPLAEDIAGEPGLLWKVWTENTETNEAGGIYLFDNEEDVERYLKKHTVRLASFGITEITAKRFAVNELLTAITRGAEVGAAATA